jgi:hypothetical protein
MLAAAVLGVLEVAYIMVQAGRARASHFAVFVQASMGMPFLPWR